MAFKALVLIMSRQHHHMSSSPREISGAPRAKFKPKPGKARSPGARGRDATAIKTAAHYVSKW